MAERWTAEGGPDEKTACGRGDRAGAGRLRGYEQVAGASGVASDLAVPPLGLGLAGDADRAVPTPAVLGRARADGLRDRLRRRSKGRRCRRAVGNTGRVTSPDRR